MLLLRLKEYADAGRIADMAPTGYKETPIRYVIDLDSSGRFLGCSDQATGEKGREGRGKPTQAPHVGRSSGVRAKLLADNGEYALGVARIPDNQRRVDQAHAAFVDLVGECAAQTGEAAVGAVLAFLGSGPIERDQLPTDFDPSATVTFRVAQQLPIDLPSVRAFWAKRSGTDSDGDGGSEKDTGRSMQCLVCGNVRPPVERLPYKWQGIHGGQTSGLALISANANAFESFGLEASRIAPTCAECGERFSKAAMSLLADNRTCLRVGPVAYIFWTREPVADFSFAGFLTDPQPEEVRNLLQAPRRGQTAAVEVDETAFYAAALSASGARVVVRDWIDTTVGKAKDSLGRYFELQQIVGYDGALAPPLKLIALAGATVRELKDLNPEVPKALLRVALGGGPLPATLIHATIQRCRAEGDVNRPRAALLKTVLLSNRDSYIQEGIPVSANLRELDQGDRDEAYLCGRLLAVLEATQRAALGDVNATIVDRYYGTASSAPATVFGRLLRGSRPHLSRLRRDPRKYGAYVALENRLMDILNDDNGLKTFPLVLDLPRQALFALGYYHQRADDRAAALRHRELKLLVTNSEESAETSADGNE
jgi:CRISPR-associated protein Csd1